MGKKNSAPSRGSKQTTRDQRKPGKKNSVPSPSRQVLTTDQIGKTAGEVWRILVEEGEQSLSALKKKIEAPSDMVLAAIGWLAREDKLKFNPKGRSMRVGLR